MNPDLVVSRNTAHNALKYDKIWQAEEELWTAYTQKQHAPTKHRTALSYAPICYHAAATSRLFQTDDAQKITRRRRYVYIAVTTTFTSSDVQYKNYQTSLSLGVAYCEVSRNEFPQLRAAEQPSRSIVNQRRGTGTISRLAS